MEVCPLRERRTEPADDVAGQRASAVNARHTEKRTIACLATVDAVQAHG